jgi:isochorismate synthase
MLNLGFGESVSELKARLCAVLGPCVRRAQETGNTVLLRVHRLCSAEIHPWGVLAAHADLSGKVPYVAWHDPVRGMQCGAWGRVFSEVCGVQSYAQAKEVQKRLLDSVMDVCLDEGVPLSEIPLVWTGFSFAPFAAWEETSSLGYMYVPQWQVYRTRNRRGWMWSCEVSPCASVESLVETYIDQSQGVCEVGGGPQGEPVVCEETALESVESWRARVQEAQKSIEQGGLSKVVLSRGVVWKAPQGKVFDVWSMCEWLKRQHAQSTTFAVSMGDGFSFVGATPELLLAVSGKELRTQALAGTAPRGATEAEDSVLGQGLLASVKNRQEHAVVSDVLLGWLQEACAEFSVCGEPRLVKLPHVQHLETPYQGTLRQAGGVLDWVEKVHPTPAVSGWPQESALMWLHANEPMKRGWYAGPLGWMTAAGDGVMVVAIRSMKVTPLCVWGFAGAGVVALSDPQAEWDETFMKLNTVRSALCVVPQGRV